jgi:hypothetical protein
LDAKLGLAHEAVFVFGRRPMARIVFGFTLGAPHMASRLITSTHFV